MHPPLPFPVLLPLIPALLLLSLHSSPTSAKTSISFFSTRACDDPKKISGPAFENESSDPLVDGGGGVDGLCYKPPGKTMAVWVQALEKGCGGKRTISIFGALTHLPCHALNMSSD